MLSCPHYSCNPHLTPPFPAALALGGKVGGLGHPIFLTVLLLASWLIFSTAVMSIRHSEGSPWMEKWAKNILINKRVGEALKFSRLITSMLVSQFWAELLGSAWTFVRSPA